MKKSLALLLTILVLLVSASACSKKADTTITPDSSTTVADEQTTAEATTNNEATTQRDVENLTVEAGRIEGKTYINDSLGIKITPPTEWEVDDESEDEFFATYITETQTGLDFKSFGVDIEKSDQYSTIQDWVDFCEASFNGDPDFMHTELRDDVNIAGINFARIDYVYPSTPDCMVTTLGAIVNGDMIMISFNQMTDDEIDDFIKNCIEF